MPKFALAERRSTSRLQVEGLVVGVRMKGRLTLLQGIAQDFNRHGLAVILDQPLPKEATVFISLHCVFVDPKKVDPNNSASSTAIKVENIIGVVHNCSAQTTGFRCGIQFRITSELQCDKREIERSLLNLESYFDDLN
ncbi:MAG: hypothetical protein GXP16_15170 [Gammaproteobacteria bacterium]|nr:hypothetical protein [Gammaproteobacteria bacterium]